MCAPPRKLLLKAPAPKARYGLDGNLTIEKYCSMDELLKFWSWPGYRDAQKLRAPLNNINFIVAIEGR